MAPQLPNEIIIQIFSYFRTVKYVDLAIHDRPLLLQEDQTLAQACLTCNTIKNIAEPLLYKTYYQAAITSTDNSDNKSCPHWRSRLFLRPLLERPILASHLEHVIVEDLGPSRRSNPSLAGASSSVDKLTRLLTNATEGLDPGKRQNDWILVLETGVEDADIAMLLLLSPKLVELDLAISSSTDFADPEGSFFPLAISASKGLQKIVMCNLTLRDPPPAYPATITCIELRHCLFSGQVVVAFSKSCAALERFILTDLYPSGWDVWQTWKPLIAELGRHRQCLKTFSLSAFPETDLYDAEVEASLWHNIGSLYHFTAPKHLTVQETALLGPVADSGQS